MRTLFFLILAPIAAYGCSKAQATSQDTPAPITVASVAKEYRKMLAMTDGPVFVNPELAALCRGVSQADIDKAKSKTGPHTNTAVRIFMNEPAQKTFHGETKPYPIGSVIVKQKEGQAIMAQKVPGRTHDGVGGMIKRAPGFDPEHGDWEYFYFEDPAKIESGKIASCVQCHAGAAGKDYVFGTWAKKEK